MSTKPYDGDYDTSEFKPIAPIRRLPWATIGLAVTVVALVSIGTCAHFGVVNHIGSLSNAAVQYTTYAAAGGIALALTPQIVKHLKPVKPICFDGLGDI